MRGYPELVRLPIFVGHERRSTMSCEFICAKNEEYMLGPHVPTPHLVILDGTRVAVVFPHEQALLSMGKGTGSTWTLPVMESAEQAC